MAVSACSYYSLILYFLSTKCKEFRYKKKEPCLVCLFSVRLYNLFHVFISLLKALITDLQSLAKVVSARGDAINYLCDVYVSLVRGEKR